MTFGPPLPLSVRHAEVESLHGAQDRVSIAAVTANIADIAGLDKGCFGAGAVLVLMKDQSIGKRVPAMRQAAISDTIET